MDAPHPVRSPRSKKRKFSRDNTLPPALPDAEKNDRLVEIALEHYNEEKDTDYELDRALLSNSFSKGNGTNHELALCSNGLIPNGNWFHCNFEAKEPNGESRRLFFAELHGRVTPFPPKTETWTVTFCTILKGTTTVGCKSCLNVVHPTYGFQEGRQKRKFSKVKPERRFSPGITTHMPSLDSWPGGSGLLSSPNSSSSSDGLSDSVDEALGAERRGVMILALEYYNKENDTSYQLVEGWNSNEFVRDGWWCHCNFTAKLPNSDTPPKFFVAEALLTDPKARTWKVTTCVILDMENKKIMSGCFWCYEVIHPISPTHGFVKGYGSE